MLGSKVASLFGDAAKWLVICPAPSALNAVSLADGAHLKRRSLVLVTGRKLLLADDSVTIQKVVDLTFTDEGLEVITVGDGQQAWEKLQEIVPDIVLADVFMPGLNGYQLCEQIKRTERLSHIPVMLLVGSFEPFDEAEARRVGADDHLTKPFQSIRTLIGKVGNLLTGGGSRESEEATTRKLAPLPEAEKENRSNADYLERATADTAPLPDVHEDAESSGVGAPEVSFADLSMDDQMIETTPAGDYGNSGHSTQTRPTAQYSAADLKDAAIAQAVEDTPALAQEETVGAVAPAEMSEPAPVAASQPQAATHASALASSEDSLLDLGDMERPPAMTEADDFFLDLLDETPQQTQASTSSWAETSTPSFESAQAAAAPTKELVSEMPTNPEEATPPQPQAQDFVEAQVIEERAEAAPVEAEATPIGGYESTQEAHYLTQQDFPVDAQLAPTERLPDDYQLEGAASVFPATEAAPERAPAENAMPHTGQITLEQLSPEVIDAIARRAVEQLSERVIEQIAWEVVPDLAELLIKRRLEEGKQ
jgi:CheY-like chemotaxis protein